jgi:hypothetical protein
MTKENALNEFKLFCIETVAKYPFPHTDGTIERFKNRLNVFTDNLKIINDILLKKANELANRIDESEHEAFKEDVCDVAQSVIADYWRS